MPGKDVAVQLDSETVLKFANKQGRDVDLRQIREGDAKRQNQERSGRRYVDNFQRHIPQNRLKAFVKKVQQQGFDLKAVGDAETMIHLAGNDQLKKTHFIT